jgi:hypothetical protein
LIWVRDYRAASASAFLIDGQEIPMLDIEEVNRKQMKTGRGGRSQRT